MVKDFRLIVSVKNNKLLKKIEDMGYKNVNQFCNENGFCASLIGNLLNMKQNPLKLDKITGEYVPIKTVSRLMDLLFCEFNDLFSDEHIKGLPTNKYSFEMSHEQLGIAHNDIDSGFCLEDLREKDELIEGIGKSLDCLTATQRDIITKRFGLDGGEPMFLGEIADLKGFSRTRARQIEQEALRRLRHPKSSHLLRQFIEDEGQ